MFLLSLSLLLQCLSNLSTEVSLIAESEGTTGMPCFIALHFIYLLVLLFFFKQMKARPAPPPSKKIITGFIEILALL